jgi:hypothetical protein
LEIATVANVEFTGVKYQFSQKELGKLSGYVDFLYNVTDFLCEFIMPTFFLEGGGGEAVQLVEALRHKTGGFRFVSW